MAQEFVSTIPDNTTNILTDNQNQAKNMNTLRSNFEGINFPDNPVTGQTCYRGDLLKEYQYNGTDWLESNSNSSIANEVKLSRGQLTSLEDRLAVSLNDDGTLKSNITANISEWIITSLVPTYVSATSFALPNDQTQVYTTNRAIRATLQSSVVYSFIVSSVYDNTINKTTVTIVDSVLDAGLQQVDYGVIQKITARGISTSSGSSVQEELDATKQWKNSHAYAVGNICYSKTAASYAYLECTVAGTTAATEPTWPAVGNTVVDGTVTWVVKRTGNNIPYNRQRYTTAGTYTFTIPQTGLYKITVVGAGGGSGGVYATTAYGAASGGGGGGGYAIKYVYLTAGDTYTVTVGAGGIAGTATSSTATDGSTGGTSSFGSLVSATGGAGSLKRYTTTTFATIACGGASGLGSGGDINGRGCAGGPSTSSSTGANEAAAFPGQGGASILSGGSLVDGGTGPNGVLGAGAGGADNNSAIGYRAGSTGGDGVILIEW